MNKSTATLAVCVLVGSVALQAMAQNGGTKPPIQQTTATAQPTSAAAAPAVVPVRIAVLNTNQVLKSFNKAQQMNNYISGKVTGYGQQITAKRDEAAKLNVELQKTVDPAAGEQLKKRITQLEREMQDLDAEARKDIGAQQGTIAVDIFKNIEDVTARVAAANGFDLVLACPDATNETDKYSQPNVVRKLASQAAVPLYFKRHIDLTDAVIQTLNATYPAPAPAATTTNTGGNPAATATPNVPTSGGAPKR